MIELFWLLLLAIAVMGWIDHRHVQELAIERSRRACDAAGVQFLDDTAALRRLKLMRDSQGVIRIWRRFTFDYSTDGDRHQGAVVMLGKWPVTLELNGQTTWVNNA